MELPGRINLAVARTCLTAALAGGVGTYLESDVRQDLQSVAAYRESSVILKYNSLDTAHKNLEKIRKDEKDSLETKSLMILPDEAFAAYTRSMFAESEAEKFIHLAKTRSVVGKELRKIKNTHEYECARAERDEIGNAIGDLETVSGALLYPGLFCLALSGFVAGVIAHP